jgi:hypothetical protein
VKFAPIVPISMLSATRKSDYHMALAPLLHRHKYIHHYESVDGHLMLDNGIAEGIHMDSHNLIDLAVKIDADEVIAPDIMHDTTATIRKLESFCRTAVHFDIAVMAVLQATNWIEFGHMLDAAMEQRPVVKVVALPKLLTQHMGTQARLAAAEMIREECHLPIHCLGSSRHLREIKDLARQGIVRGIDSAAPAVLGIQGLSVRHAEYEWETSHKAIPDFWDQEQNSAVEENIDIINKWCATTSAS